MSDSSKETTSKSGIGGWLKALIAAVFSAASGAALMYASPLLDSVIKPAKPVANFQAQVNGLNVTFQNKSTGGHEGWWDFGDGSAMEPFVPDEPAIAHTYAKAGTYTVKLSLKNIINEANDRTANVSVDPTEATSPKIEAFNVIPVNGDYAPAAFHVITKVKNADMCVWALGDRPMEFNPDPPDGNQERYVTFKEPGIYVMRLAITNGKQTDEKYERVEVKAAPKGMVTATLAVTYEAARTDHKKTSPFVQMHFQVQDKGDVQTVIKQIQADPGFEFIKADVVQPIKGPFVNSAKVQIDPAKRDTVVLTSELKRPSAKTAVAPACVVQLALVQQRRAVAVAKAPEPVSMNLAVPGTTLMPLPQLASGWEAKSRKMTLDLQQDGRSLGRFDGNMPHNAAVQIGGGVYVFSATEQNGQLRVDAVAQGAGKVIGN
ncbi:MAG TPA: PKD domain-containing protein [Gemmataceae bacterium]|nr:PKD domain-containing protein [Gemmataceae bacterium]